MRPTKNLVRFLPLLCMLVGTCPAQKPIDATANQTVRIVGHGELQPTPQDYAGLSFETLSIEPDKSGKYRYFFASNRPLIQLFQTLGIHSLRIGGNTSDNPRVPMPTTADIDALFGFAQAAKVKVIYTLRLRESTPDKIVPTARYLMSHYANSIACVVIGNEPDVYEPTAVEDDKQILAYIEAMRRGGVTPFPRLCGPSTTPSHPQWASQFGDDLAPAADVLWITQHSYPGGNGRKVASPQTGREALLDGSFDAAYNRLLNSFAPEIQKHGLRYRIEETNNYYFGGAENVSNTFASALWGLDYLYWWAEHGAAGVNFHTGDEVAAADEQTPCWYATFWSDAQGVHAKPLAYAIAAFDQVAHGQVLSLERIHADRDLSVHATHSDSGDLYVTLINKSHGPQAHPSNILVQPSSRFASADIMMLQDSNGRIEVGDGVTLGSAKIDSNGDWNGKWKSFQLSSGMAQVSVPAATAVLLRLRYESVNERPGGDHD